MIHVNQFETAKQKVAEVERKMVIFILIIEQNRK